MKKTLCSLAILGAFVAGSAQAQTSVTLYGIIDAGFMTQNNNGSTPSAGRVSAFTDAQILPSIYGMKGTEDLGGGLSAGFNLEGGFNSGNGTHNSPGVYQTQMFGREAKVTLSGDWGTFGAGMQVDPGLIAAIATEPRGMTDSFSNLEYWILATLNNNIANGGSLQGGIFDQNALTYTYSKNGLYLGLEYGFGGVAGSTSANSTASVGVSYSYSGFVVSGSYSNDESNDPTTGGTSSQIDVFGLGYDFGNIAVRGQYSEFKFGYVSGNATSDIKSWGVGVDFKTGVANKINFSYYNAKDDGSAPGVGGSTDTFALLDILALSKHTQVYAQYAYVKADGDAGASATIGGIYTSSGSLFATAGATTNYFGVGLQHSF